MQGTFFHGPCRFENLNASFIECMLSKLICSMHKKDIAIIYSKFHSNYTWNLIHKICTEGFLFFPENTLFSLLRLIFF